HRRTKEALDAALGGAHTIAVLHGIARAPRQLHDDEVERLLALPEGRGAGDLVARDTEGRARRERALEERARGGVALTQDLEGALDVGGDVRVEEGAHALDGA